jgi:Restriction endonuclease
VWTDPTPAGRFEEIVGELLERSGQVSWIRRVGATTERDRGRDFVAEWVTATSAEELPQGVSPQVRIPVVVQCKAVGRAVNVGDVPAIIGIVEEHQAHGYFLAVSTRLTAPLVDRLTALRQRGHFEVVDWWGRAEIERELRNAPDLLARFADVVRPE